MLYLISFFIICFIWISGWTALTIFANILCSDNSLEQSINIGRNHARITILITTIFGGFYAIIKYTFEIHNLLINLIQIIL